MDHLPLNDIPMLVSAINYLLRDEEFEHTVFFIRNGRFIGSLAVRNRKTRLNMPYHRMLKL